MDIEEKEHLILRGQRLSSLCAQSGWKDVEELLDQMQESAFNVLIDAKKDDERHYARGVLKAVEDIKRTVKNAIVEADEIIKDRG